MEMEIVRPNSAALKALLDLANDSLRSPVIKESIVGPGQEKWVHEISETTLRMLSSCASIKDVLLLLKDHLHSLRSTFRRISIGSEREGEDIAPAGNKFSCYSLQRKELKKAMIMRLDSLKGMKNACIASHVPALNQNLITVINVLRQVRMTTMSIVESLLSLTSIACPSPKPRSKNRRGLFVVKLTRLNSLSSWDNCSIGVAILRATGERLQAAEIAIEDIEEELECIFRRLVQTRVSLLNILNN